MVIYLACLWLCLAVCVHGKKRAYCLQSLAEPTLGEIILSAVPLKLPDHWIPWTGGPTAANSAPWWTTVLDAKVPLLSVFSSGVYTVRFTGEPDFIAQDVQIVQESFAAFNVPCNLAFSLNVPFLKSWCSCSHDTALELSEWENVPLPRASAPFCRADPPCTTNHYIERSCSIPVADPFRTSCVVIDSELPLTNAVTYRMSTPSVYDYTPNVSLPIHLGEPFETAIATAAQPIAQILSAIPIHAVLLVLGLVVTVTARDLAENIFVQTILQSALGISLALLVLGFMLYRPIEKIVSRYGGLVTVFFPYSFLTTLGSLVYRNPSVGWRILAVFYDFWAEGAFGLPLLGKIYFLGSVALSCSLCWYFQWFEPDSRLWPIMLFAVRGIGLWMLSMASTSRDLSLLFVLAGLVLEQIRPTLELLLLLWEAHRQPSHAPVRIQPQSGKMGADAVAEMTRKTTQAALEDLRKHLQGNPEDLNKVTNRLLQAGNKSQEAMLVSKFVHGAYSGLPLLPEEGEPAGTSWGKFLFRLIALAGAVVVLWIAAALAFRRNIV